METRTQVGRRNGPPHSRRAGVWASGLLALMWIVAASAAPTAKAGPFTVRVESISRALDLTQPVERQAATVITLGIEGALDDISRITEPAQDTAATDGTGRRLDLQESLILSRSTPPHPGRPSDPAARGRIRVQLRLTPASRNADTLSTLSTSLLCYERREAVRLDFISVAGESPALQRLDGMLIRPVLPQQRQVQARNAYDVKVYVRVSDDGETSAAQWQAEQVELIDSQGRALTPLSTSRMYQYDGKGQVTGRTITATFAVPAQPPRGVRYRAERLEGIESLPCRFENLPLP